MSNAKIHKRFWRRPLYLTLALSAAIIACSWILPVLQPFVAALLQFWHRIWWALLLGLIIAGMIDALVPNKYIVHYLAKSGSSSIFNAAIFGFLMSVCSHGILAIAMELYKKGASAAAVITFLLASPWANMAITFTLIAFFGWRAAAFIVAALVIAIITGFIYQALEQYGIIPANKNTIAIEANFTISKDIKQRFKNFSWQTDSLQQLLQQILAGAWSMAHMILWWIIIGTLLGSAMIAYVPHDIFQTYLGPSVLGLFITLGVATIIEVCSEGSAPIAFAIYNQTGAFGNAFVFLMAGVITDFTEIALVWSNIGNRAALLLPLITVPQTVLVAYLFNKFL